MSDSEAFLYVYTVYFHTHRHLPTCIDLITGVRYFFTGAQMIYSVGGLDFFFTQSLHKCLNFRGAQHPDLSRLIEGPWCLLCSVPPHCAVAIIYPDIFYMSHTSPTTGRSILLYGMGNSLESFFKRSSVFSRLLVISVLSIVNISFATFVSQREDYILTVRMCVQVCNQN